MRLALLAACVALVACDGQQYERLRQAEAQGAMLEAKMRCEQAAGWPKSGDAAMEGVVRACVDGVAPDIFRREMGEDAAMLRATTPVIVPSDPPPSQPTFAPFPQVPIPSMPPIEPSPTYSSDWMATSGPQPVQPMPRFVPVVPGPATGASGGGLMAAPSYHPDPATGAGGWGLLH